MNLIRLYLIFALVVLSTTVAHADLIDVLLIERTDFTDEPNGAAVQAEYDTGNYRVWQYVALFSDPEDELLAVTGNSMAFHSCTPPVFFQGPNQPENQFHRPDPFANFVDPRNALDSYAFIGTDITPKLVGDATLPVMGVEDSFGGAMCLNGGWVNSVGSDGGVAGDDLMVGFAQITVQYGAFPVLGGVLSYVSNGLVKDFGFMILPNPCMVYDLNDDYIVNVLDLLVLLESWGGDGRGAELTVPFDVVDVADLLLLLENWGHLL